MGNTILAKGVNHILAKRDNSAWPKGSKLSGFSSLMLEMDAAHFSILLNSLKREIESNISTYNTCKEFFDRLDTGYVCRQHESRFDWGIDRQMKVTNGYYRELMEANGSLEAVGFREHDRQEEELLERRYERCKREYDKEKTKLDELYTLVLF